jgi:hypothetical protein
MVFDERCIGHSLALLLAQNHERTCTSHPSSHRYSQWCLLRQHVLRIETAVNGSLCILERYQVVQLLSKLRANKVCIITLSAVQQQYAALP